MNRLLATMNLGQYQIKLLVLKLSMIGFFFLKKMWLQCKLVDDLSDAPNQCLIIVSIGDVYHCQRLFYESVHNNFGF